jgi:ActR/RegA family two-component response regulator
MQPSNVVLLQSDPNLAQTLATSLSNSFHRVHVAESLDDLRHAVARTCPFAIVVDLEIATLGDVASLKQDFREIRIICNHRVADEEMWSCSLSVGADDCCPSDDMRGILSATVRESARSMAA